MVCVHGRHPAAASTIRTFEARPRYPASGGPRRAQRREAFLAELRRREATRDLFVGDASRGVLRQAGPTKFTSARSGDGSPSGSATAAAGSITSVGVASRIEAPCRRRRGDRKHGDSYYYKEKAFHEDHGPNMTRAVPAPGLRSFDYPRDTRHPP